MKEDSFLVKLGTFDLMKGLCILFVIIWHTFPLMNMFHTTLLKIVVGGISSIFIPYIMPAFFVMSGYGFRFPNTPLNIRRQVTRLLRPFFYVAITTCLVHLVLHYTCFHYFPGACKETAKLMAGFLLAIPTNHEIFGHAIFGCGAVWYLVSLAVGWCLLYLTFKIVPKPYCIYVILILAFGGWFLGRIGFIWFCIPQGMIASFYLYQGYVLKKKRLLEQRWDFKKTVLCMLCMALSGLGVLYRNDFDNIAESIWNLGPLSIVADGVLAWMLIYWFSRFGESDSPCLKPVKIVGKYSLYVFCLHSIELMAVPWYLIESKLSFFIWINKGIIFLLRAMVITMGCLLLHWKKYSFRIKGD